MEGAVLLARALIDSEVFASEKLLKVWIWILISATHKKVFIPVKVGTGISTISLGRGQLLFGRLKAQEILDIDESFIYRSIKKLEKLGNISLKTTPHYTIITICNYEYYQDLKNYKRTTSEQPLNNNRTTSEQPLNTFNNDNNDNNDNKENIYATEKIEKSEEEKKWEEVINKHYPRLFKMRQPLIYDEHLALIEKYGKGAVAKVYERMQNWPDLIKKRESANLTARNFLRTD